MSSHLSVILGSPDFSGFDPINRLFVALIISWVLVQFYSDAVALVRSFRSPTQPRTDWESFVKKANIIIMTFMMTWVSTWFVPNIYFPSFAIVFYIGYWIYSIKTSTYTPITSPIVIRSNTLIIITLSFFILWYEPGCLYRMIQPQMSYFSGENKRENYEYWTRHWLDLVNVSRVPKMRIQFYGEAVDELGKPVSGHLFTCMNDFRPPWNGDTDQSAAQRYKSMDVTTGPDGRFTVQWEGGEIYVKSGTHITFFARFDYHDPHFYLSDRQNPAIFVVQDSDK